MADTGHIENDKQHEQSQQPAGENKKVLRLESLELRTLADPLVQFAMYNARQYEKPEGHFTEQTSRDGEKWYKVYATTRVEKTPTVQDERGRMQYDERKVAAMPKAPARRH